MKRTLKIGALLVIGVVLAGTALAADAPQSSTRPPKNLKKVGDHWTAWDPPAAAPDSYLIQKGDTFWDLAGKWLNNPYLWPQIWEQNKYVLDSHWIYPGDPIVKPAQPTVVPPEGPPKGEEQPVSEGQPAAAEQAPAPAEAVAAPPAPRPLVPLADASDLYCTGFIETNHQIADLRVAGRESERSHVAEGDVVYLNKGAAQGVKSGEQYGVIRAMKSVTHPVTGAALGRVVHTLGKARVLCTQENTSIAVIEMSCEDIVDQDELIPWADLQAPAARSIPKCDRCDQTPSGGEVGYVVAAKDDLQAVGNGYVVYIDLGSASGVAPGAFLTVYREQGDLPRLVLGRAVILRVGETTATVKILQVKKEISPGDRVEVLR